MNKAQIERMLSRVTQELEALQKEWDLYFMGHRKLPPYPEKQKLERDMRDLRNTKSSDNTIRFRIMNLVARCNSYLELWNRKMREIEEGPMHFKRRQTMIAELSGGPGPIVQKSPGQVPAGQSAQKSGQNSENGNNGQWVISDPGKEKEAMQELYRRYLDEVEKTQKRRATLSFDAFNMNIGQQIEVLERKNNCQSVSVAVKSADGKVKVKIKPVSEET